MEPLPNTAAADEIANAHSEKVEQCHANGVKHDANAVAIEETTTAGLEKTVSRHTQRSRISAVSTLAEPPDGGLNAWLKVFGCFLMVRLLPAFLLEPSANILTVR
jgi:hypothetical protein